MLKSSSANQPPANRSELAYQSLKEQLLSGDLPHGSPLSSYNLAKTLGISRTPVTHALKRLENEGLVEIIPQVGCRVAQPTPAEVVEVFTLRAVLEGLAAEIAALRIDEAELQALQTLLQEGESAIHRNDSAAYSLINKEFHALIVSACGMVKLEELLDKFRDFARYCTANHPFFSEERMSVSSQEHHQIVAALKIRDSQKARHLLEMHLRQTGEAFSSFLTNL